MTESGEILSQASTELDVTNALAASPQDIFLARSGNWETPADWSTGSAPTETEDAFIGAGGKSAAISDKKITVHSIRANSLSSLTIGDDSTFTATNGTVLNSAGTSSKVYRLQKGARDS